MASFSGKFHKGGVKNCIKMSLRDFGAQFFLATAVARIKDRSDHPNAILGQQLFQNRVIGSANSKEETKRFTCVTYDPK